jgi:hypothetical protein
MQTILERCIHAQNARENRENAHAGAPGKVQGGGLCEALPRIQISTTIHQCTDDLERITDGKVRGKAAQQHSSP